MNSRVLTIAREDFKHALRDKLLWGAFALVALLMVPTFWRNSDSGVFTIRKVISILPFDFRMYIVILVAVVSYRAIVGERESGTVRLLLGLPGTRRDIVVGKLLSKIVMVVITLVPILVILDVILAVKYGTLYLDTVIPVFGLMILYAVVWTGFVVGVSAAFSTQYRTLAALICTYLFFSSLVDIWSTFVLPLFSLVFSGKFSTIPYQSLGTGTEPLWVSYTGRLNPIATFGITGKWLGSLADPATPTTYLLPNIFGIMMLVLFGFVPLLIGYYRFERADLG